MYNKSVRKDGEKEIVIKSVFDIIKIKTQGNIPVSCILE
jgi:hypothetical protein